VARRKILKAFIVSYLFFLTALVSSWAVLHVYEGGGKFFTPSISQKIVFFASVPSKIKTFAWNVFYNKPHNIEGHLIFNKYYKDGITLYDTTLSKKLIGLNLMISTYNTRYQSNEIKLVSLSTLKLIKRWLINDTSLLYKRKIPGRFSILMHPLFHDQKNIICRDFPYLTKINENGDIVWDKFSLVHHSLELDSDNNLWACGLANYDLSYISTDSIYNDAIYKINPSTGEVVFKKSVYSILHENGFSSLLTIGVAEGDPLHINDIQPALYSTSFWEKGDLLISLRHRNSVFLYRPSTNKIVWLKTGPWSNQHDCDFVDSSKILVFGNDIIRYRSHAKFINGYNNLYVFDLMTREVKTPYTKFFKNNNISTEKEGLSELLPNGDLFVEETCNGRILIGDTNKVKLIYVEREDKNFIKRFNWSRIIRDDEITGLNLNK
jgi:hypothetical protein